MLNLIILIVFLFSLIGIIYIIYKKIPLLKTLPEKKDNKINWKTIYLNFKNSSFFKKIIFNLDIFLQKFLSRIKILVLKIENKISYWLQKLRKRIQKRSLEKNNK